MSTMELGNTEHAFEKSEDGSEIKYVRKSMFGDPYANTLGATDSIPDRFILL